VQVCALLMLGCQAAFAAPAAADLRLVLQVTVDGLRADLLERYEDRLEPPELSEDRHRRCRGGGLGRTG
jgi:hypothetical protein